VKTSRILLAAAVVLFVASLAMCQASRPAGVMGSIVKVDGSNIVVSVRQRGAEATEKTVATDSKTEFVVDAEAGKLADLKPEMRVVITPETGTAVKVVAHTRGLMGQIVKVEGKNVVVNSRAGGETKEVTVVTDDKTKVFVDDKPAKLEDLKADMFVTVLPETGTATKIMTMAGRMGGGRGGNRPAGQ
jgi:prolyl oligopeptidase PreP (S9A serine peptidase family)